MSEIKESIANIPASLGLVPLQEVTGGFMRRYKAAQKACHQYRQAIENNEPVTEDMLSCQWIYPSTKSKLRVFYFVNPEEYEKWWERRRKLIPIGRESLNRQKIQLSGISLEDLEQRLNVNTSLTEQGKDILARYFGLRGYQAQPLRKIAREYDISFERVRQLVKTNLTKLGNEIPEIGIVFPVPVPLYSPLKLLYLKHGLTGKKLADELKIHLGTLSRWNTGRGKPSKENIAKMAQVLNVPEDDVLTALETAQEKDT